MTRLASSLPGITRYDASPRRVHSALRRASLLSALIVASSAPAQVDVMGAVADSTCSSLLDAQEAGGLLFAVKLEGDGSDVTDWLWDTDLSGTSFAAGCPLLPGSSVEGTDLTGSVFIVPGRWREPQTLTSRQYVFATMNAPPSEPPAGVLHWDSLGDLFMPMMESSLVQRVGARLPVGIDAGEGPHDPVGWIPGGFTFRFGLHAEVNSLPVGMAGCTVGGEVGAPSTEEGLIIGYNIYRVALSEITGPTPTLEECAGGGVVGRITWEYFARLEAVDLTVPTTAPGDADLDPDGDLIDVWNPDGMPWTGDELLVFMDLPTNPDGSPRESGTGPDPFTRYFYNVQPVVAGDPAQFAAPFGFGASDAFDGTHRTRCVLAGIDFGPGTGVDLDLDGEVEFCSPQATIGRPGLGLTMVDRGCTRIPFLCDPAPNFSPLGLAVDAAVDLTGARAPGGVMLTLRVSLERGDVVGYRILREGPRGDTVVTASLLPPAGTEGATLHVLDPARGSARVARRSGGVLRYVVEIVGADGETARRGPFQVALEETGSRRRASRR